MNAGARRDDAFAQACSAAGGFQVLSPPPPFLWRVG